ncbi:unnamed protein product [Nyctereutes procyonoides]|uniref:(raccoon dog) hypothetical protein n=1 Tax=Nyctereutes procyonoides TaxID=34880 RepID=A0A811ZC84_NYCPR|nr:unnamed protein product [Nyctereutes procyonoides]
MLLGKLDIHMQKNETRPLSCTIHKDKLKMDERSKNVRQDSIKILEENTGNTLFELDHSNFLQDTISSLFVKWLCFPPRQFSNCSLLIATIKMLPFLLVVLTNSNGSPLTDGFSLNYKRQNCIFSQFVACLLILILLSFAEQMFLILMKSSSSIMAFTDCAFGPNNYRIMHGRAVNGSQLGKDYIQLKSLLQPIRIYSRASLYGPNIGRPRKNVIALLDGFMKVAGSTVDAVTWQHCYIDGRVVKVMDFLKTRLLDTLSDQIRKIQKVVNTYTPGKKIWLEGVVTTSAGGTNNLSDSYAAGFLWLNTLGMLANQGIDVVIRHSFFDHGYNHLVDQNFNPLPDYWLSLLYKRLIGPKVLAVHVAGLQRKPRPGRVIRDKLRIYAHCTNHHNHNYVRGSITLFIINLHRSRKKIKLAGTLRDKLVHQYLLQPYGQEGLKSKSVQLNGQPLVMVDDGTLPELKPRPLRPGRTLVIPPVTMGFYVVKNVNALACRYR